MEANLVSGRSGVDRLSILLVDRDDNVVVSEYVIFLCPALDSIVINGVSSSGIVGERLEEVRGEEVNTISRDLEIVVQIPRSVSKSKKTRREENLQ